MWYVFLAIAFAASLQPLTVCGSLVCGRLLSAANSEFDDVSSGAPFVVTVCFASASCRTNLKLDLHTAEYFSDIRRAVRTRDGSYLSACDKSKLEARQTFASGENLGASNTLASVSSECHNDRPYLAGPREKA